MIGKKGGTIERNQTGGDGEERKRGWREGTRKERGKKNGGDGEEIKKGC